MSDSPITFRAQDELREEIERLRAIREKTLGELEDRTIEVHALRAIRDELVIVLTNIKRFGEIGCVIDGGAFPAGGKKPPAKEVWSFPRHMLPEIDAAIKKAKEQP